MSYPELLGHVVTLTVRRFGPPGAFFSVDATDQRPNAATILLPGAEVPEGTKVGDELDVFVYLDSEDRPVATVCEPQLMLDEVSFLVVNDVTSFGAFVDWGLPKDLLVPLGHQTCDMVVGQRYAVGLFVDDTGRLAGTMRVGEMLHEKGDFKLDEWVHGEAWRNDPELGVFVIVERQFVGLLPASEPHGLSRGEAARFRVSSVLPDGKIELSLRGHAHEELENDAQKILSVLRTKGAPRIGDRSSPEAIRSLFGLSKKAFKRAVGRLLKTGAVTLDRNGFVAVERGGAG